MKTQPSMPVHDGTVSIVFVIIRQIRLREIDSGSVAVNHCTS
jgi:hypothetical protein